VPALILDCDGVLAETEREGHLVAFNHAFAQAGLTLRWTEAEYRELLRIGGGTERLRADPRVPNELVGELHARKTATFARLVADGVCAPRPGVVRLCDEALADDWSVAVASTSAAESVQLVVERVLPRRPVCIVAGDAAPAKKPDPAVYELALRELGCRPTDAVAVEDSRIGLLAAVRAGVSCIVTPSWFTRDDDFREATLIADDLSEIGIADLTACLKHTRSA
jgi:HAD superfamily hydrolase (TIGR01509 family)